MVTTRPKMLNQTSGVEIWLNTQSCDLIFCQLRAECGCGRNQIFMLIFLGDLRQPGFKGDQE